LTVNEIVFEITSCLAQQNALIEELIKTGQKQVDGLKADIFHEIVDSINNQEKLGKQLALLEKQRLGLVRQLGQVIGKRDLKIKEIAKLASPDQRQQLDELTENIIMNQQKLQEINNLAALLLKQSLNYTQKVLQCLQPREQKTYDSTGQLEQAAKINVINWSI